MQQLLEPHVRDITVGTPLDQHGHLIVACHLRAQEVEFGGVSNFPPELRLRECRIGLRQRRLRDHDQPIGELRIVVRLRHVQRELRLRGRQADGCASPAGVCGSVLRGDSTAREQVLLQRQPEIPLVCRAKAEVLERAEGVAPRAAAERGLEQREPLIHGRVGVHEERAAGGRARTVAAEAQSLELRLERARVASGAEDLGQELAARLVALPFGARHTRARDREIRALCRGAAQGIVERKPPHVRARGCVAPLRTGNGREEDNGDGEDRERRPGTSAFLHGRKLTISIKLARCDRSAMPA